MYKLFRFRHCIVFNTKHGVDDIRGDWQYVYCPEEIPPKRSVESKTVFDFNTAYKECYEWHKCIPGKSFFKKRPYIHVWDIWGGHRYYENDIEEIHEFMEYEEASNSLTLKELYELLPSDHFIQYCVDRVMTVFHKDWRVGS